jgi:ferredoxin-NADP reductase
MKLIFVGKEPEADGAASFRFSPIEPLVWIAGQSIKIELPAGYDTQERRFTIAAAPLEKDVVITTRVSDSEFKQALAALTPGSETSAYNIDGSFTWRQSNAPHVFAANGVGVTPFYAMLRQRHLEQKPLSATLLYANPTAEFILGAQLQELATQHPEFRVIFLPTQRLHADTVLQHWQPHQLLYLSGAAKKVDALGDTLLARGVPESLLMRDWFNGQANWDER